MSDRHPDTEHLLDLFVREWKGLRMEHEAIPKLFGHIAHEMAKNLSDGPELRAGLRKLLEAKDCFVRQERIDRYSSNSPDNRT